MKFDKFGPAIRKRLWVGILLVLALVFLLSAMRYLQPTTKSDLPRLGLMTTLPLQWSEGGVEAAVDADAAPHPAYARLAAAYDIVPLDNLDEIDRHVLLLLAQPRALSPGELVQLDAWVRRGGRLLLLADPALQWGSVYPLGDKRRPLFTSMLSPLFSHWGIELVLPIDKAEPVAVRQIDGLTIRTLTPGEWRVKRGSIKSPCALSANAIFADCSVGKGRALLVADADLLDTPHWHGRGARMLTGADESGNVAWVELLLGRLRDNVGK
jgi:ABC-type uncharacterized transport system